MSGGSYDYVCFKIQDIELNNTHLDPRRAAFQKLLKLVGKAMHDIEWVDSCDYGKGDEHSAIDECFSFISENPDKLIKAAAFEELQTILKNYFGERQAGDE